MATLREYFEKDFVFRLRLSAQLIFDEHIVDICVLIDLEGIYVFSALYVSGTGLSLHYFVSLVSYLRRNRILYLVGDWTLTLPNARSVQKINIKHGGKNLQFDVTFVGDRDVTGISIDSMPASPRIFIYSETVLEQHEVNALMETGTELGCKILFRSEEFRAKRSIAEVPLAFISYDSRDREIAGKIAWELQGMLCPVWYDQFSLEIGDSLRESIEERIKKFKKCILIIIPNFIKNPGWTKTEFNSIFNRQLLFNEKLILPIWHNVSRNEIYDYSHSLLDVFALEWQDDGADVICRKLYQKLIPLEE